MATVETKNLLNNQEFISEAEELYTDSIENTAERYANLLEMHKQNIKGENIFFSSPGRIEVIGNHTDHNNGKVVAASVSVDTLAVVTPLTDNKIIIKSMGYPEVTVNINDTNIYESEKSTSAALVRGVVRGFVDRGYAVGGFYATAVSNVFKGAGMSSSASFEVLIAEILNVLYNNGKVDAVTKAIVSQYAENVYFGKPSGLMDQAAIALGSVSYIDFKDTQNPIVKKPNWNFEDVSVVVVNCGGDHCDLTQNYADIRFEMEGVANYFGKQKLRFVDKTEFTNALPDLIKKTSGRAIMRAMHYFEENERVENLYSAINESDEQKALSIITASGMSSLKKLQNLYPEGNSSEPIPLALAIAENFDGVKAYRVHGGGFAGTILTFVEKGKVGEFVDYMAKLYGKENVFSVKIRSTGARKLNFKI